MIATEPLTDAFWAEAGMAERETFSDLPPPDHLRAADRRQPDGLRWSGCALPFRLDHPAGVRPRRPESTSHCVPRWSSCFRPCRRPGSPIAGAARWASPGTGSPRWASIAGPAPAWAGGYVGDGVSTTNLAGRTLRDLILRAGHRTVGAAVGRTPVTLWEPEPLRFLGINAGLRLAGSADRSEEKKGRTTWKSRALQRMIGA